MAATPWYTSNDLIASIKRKISFPISQNTFTVADILAFANEEMFISQVPSVMLYHEEYFVIPVTVPLVANQSRYSIPDRAIGLKMRDVFYKDSQGILYELTRISSEDKAYWQANIAASSGVDKFYIEGNDIIITPQVQGAATGSLVFYIYLRPNQLVRNERACIIQNFAKTITISTPISGDKITINSTVLTGGTDWAIGVSDTATAANIANAINSNGVAMATAATNVVTITYSDLSTVITSSTSHMAVQTTQGIVFDQVPTTYLDPDTNVVSNLYADGVLIDFLQTKPGHKIRTYDVIIPTSGIAGTTINFNSSDVPTDLIIGDYICLANEAIIPQLPPDLHNSLAERTCVRILAAIGDQQGMQSSMQKIAEMDQRTGTLIDNRSEGAPKKITGRHGLLRYGKRGRNWRL